MPYSSDPSLKIIQWPPFLLASKVSVVWNTIDFPRHLMSTFLPIVFFFGLAFADPNSIGYGGSV